VAAFGLRDFLNVGTGRKSEGDTAVQKEKKIPVKVLYSEPTQWTSSYLQARSVCGVEGRSL